MPAPTTTEEFLDIVRKSGLIPPQPLEVFAEQATEAAPAQSPRELAGLLIAAGLVTQFQAEQFLQGKWRGFTIGKYKVLERLGAGGMGTVYLCEHMQVGRKAAVKVLPTGMAHNPAALGRFYREGRAAGVLDHPNLVKAHDIDSDGGLHFLVMDYIDGSSLQYIVTRCGPFSIPRACSCIRQAAVGLHHAHQAGLLHRDVKPANIMLERNGNIRVLDLGLARFIHDTTDLLTLKYDDRNVLGTADFVSPEQALNSHEVDVRTDVYGLGATFYFLLVGHPPFPEGKIAQKLIWHQVRQPTPVRQLRPETPEELETVVEKMMAKNPAHRYQTMAEVIDALTVWAGPPVPPPEREMPRLSPAATPSSGKTSQHPLPTDRRRTVAGPAVLQPEPQSGGVGTLHRPASQGDLPTPNILAMRPTVADGHKPTDTTPFAPSLPLQHTAKQASSSRLSVLRTVLVLLGLAVTSALAGVLTTWWLVGR